MFQRTRSVARPLHLDMRGRDVTSGGTSFVTVVQAVDFPECDYVTLGYVLMTMVVTPNQDGRIWLPARRERRAVRG